GDGNRLVGHDLRAGVVVVGVVVDVHVARSAAGVDRIDAARGTGDQPAGSHVGGRDRGASRVGGLSLVRAVVAVRVDQVVEAVVVQVDADARVVLGGGDPYRLAVGAVAGARRAGRGDRALRIGTGREAAQCYALR